MNTQRVEGHSPLPWVKDKDGQLNGANGESVNTWGLGMGFAPRSVLTEANANYVLYAVNNIERLEKVNEALAIELMAANAQMEAAAECIEKGRYDEALLHVRSMSRKRAEVIRLAKEPA